MSNQDNQTREQTSQSGASQPVDETGGFGELMGFDPGATDLGDDVYRDANNRGSTILPRADSASVEAGLDAGNTDLGDDVYRDVNNRGSLIEGGGSSDPHIEWGNTDLGPDAERSAGER